MLVEHIQITTTDSVRLDGLFAPPLGNNLFHFDAVLLVHGLMGNFYGSRLLNGLAEFFTNRGVATLRANNRGHDGINVTPKGLSAQRMGSAYEIVDDCRADITACVDWLGDRGCEKVAILGHSLGGIKTLYSQCIQPHRSVTQLIALSATRLNYDQFAQSSKSDVYAANYERARQLVQAGNEKQLIQIDFPFPTVIAADAYVDKYGPDSRYDWFQLIHQLTIPSLLLFGERELKTPAFDGILQELEKTDYPRQLVNISIVPGGDHYYTGTIEKVFDLIKNWSAP